MTSIVGVLSRDGVVVGTDSSATFAQGQMPIMEQPYEKIHIIGDRYIVAGTGQIGLGQRFIDIVQRALDSRALENKSSLDVARELAQRAIQDFANTKVEHNQFGALIAFPTGDKPNLCEFSVVDFQPELKTDKLWFASMGSAQLITDPFLAFIREIYWTDGMPSLAEAVFAVIWTLDHAVAINPGGVNGPVKISVLEQKSNKLRARILSDEELLEHRENITECKNALRELRNKHQPENELTPVIPKPS